MGKIKPIKFSNKTTYVMGGRGGCLAVLCFAWLVSDACKNNFAFLAIFFLMSGEIKTGFNEITFWSEILSSLTAFHDI